MHAAMRSDTQQNFAPSPSILEATTNAVMAMATPNSSVTPRVMRKIVGRESFILCLLRLRIFRLTTPTHFAIMLARGVLVAIVLSVCVVAVCASSTSDANQEALLTGFARHVLSRAAHNNAQHVMSQTRSVAVEPEALPSYIVGKVFSSLDCSGEAKEVLAIPVPSRQACGDIPPGAPRCHLTEFGAATLSCVAQALGDPLPTQDGVVVNVFMETELCDADVPSGRLWLKPNACLIPPSGDAADAEPREINSVRLQVHCLARTVRATLFEDAECANEKFTLPFKVPRCDSSASFAGGPGPFGGEGDSGSSSDLPLFSLGTTIRCTLE